MRNTTKTKNHCKKCGKEIKCWKIYCNRKCYFSSSPKFLTECKICGKKFFTYPCHVKKNQGFLCSRKCKSKWDSNLCRGEEEFKNPKQANYARAKLNHEIERKGFKRESCVVCGNKKSQAHHEDYSKPLEVVWLCAKHHKLLHLNKLKI